VDGKGQAALWAATIAACATIAGYLFNQSLARRERKARAFAEALSDLRRYQDFPFKIWRRSTADADSRQRLSEEQSAIGIQVRFHLVWLQIDSPVVGEAYQSLWNVVRPARRANRLIAWTTPPRIHDRDMAAEPRFQQAVGWPEMALCIRAMRNELSFLAPLRRRHLRRLIREQAQRMAPAP
jgi:hypothetical protein